MSPTTLSQSLNPQTVVGFESQEAESGWIIQNGFCFVVQKHSHERDCEDKFSALNQSS